MVYGEGDMDISTAAEFGSESGQNATIEVVRLSPDNCKPNGKGFCKRTCHLQPVNN